MCSKTKSALEVSSVSFGSSAVRILAFHPEFIIIYLRVGLPPWATKFIEMVLMLTADHGPAVSGAMNTIVATRAGKDLISSLASGLLTIGSRFGGALDEAASMFSTARDTGLTPREFVDESRKANKLSKLVSEGMRARH